MRFLSSIAVVVLLPVLACETSSNADGEKGSEEVSTISQEVCAPGVCTGQIHWGLGEPIAWNQIRGWDLEEQVDQVIAVGAPIFRSWGPTGYCFSGPETFDTECIAIFKRVISRLQAAKITVIQADGAPTDAITGTEAGLLPCRDTAPGSRYMMFLERWSKQWATMGRLFPELRYFQIGNEWNMQGTLRPEACDPDGYSLEERTTAVADLTYYARRGLKSTNPNAFVFMGSLAPVEENGNIDLIGIARFYDVFYQRIESGQLFSKNPRDYFDGLSWHPYVWQKPTVSNWVEPNQFIHKILQSHGEGSVPVWFSELGDGDFSDGTRSVENANSMMDTWIMAHQFPWLWGVTWFRMCNDSTATWGAQIERTYGIMGEPLTSYDWKTSAFTMWSINKNLGRPGRVFSYEFDGDAEPYETAGVEVLLTSGGWLLGKATDSDAQVITPPMSLDASSTSRAEITMAVWGGDTRAQLFFATQNSPDWSEAQSISFSVIGDGKPHTYNLDLRATGWAGQVTRLRLDPLVTANQFMIDSIRFY